MGPREALAQIMVMIERGKATEQPAELHDLLREMEAVARRAVSRRNFRRARSLLPVGEREQTRRARA